MTIITHLAQRPRKKNTGTLRPKRGSAKRDRVRQAAPVVAWNPGSKRTGFSISREYFDNLPRPKTDTVPRTAVADRSKFSTLVQAPRLHLWSKSQISNLKSTHPPKLLCI